MFSIKDLILLNSEQFTVGASFENLSNTSR
jgi:hypothetical protein